MPADEDSERKPLKPVTRVVISTVMAAAGEKIGPGGGLALAPFAPSMENMIRGVRDEFTATATRRQMDMLGVTAEALGQDPEDLPGMAGKSDHTVLLTAKALAGAAGTAWPRKVSALGRALADGLIADDDQINIADLVLPAMTDMERPHVSLLELLVRWVPDEVMGRPVGARPDPVPPAPSGDRWHAGQRIWKEYQISQVRPTLEPVVISLIGTLVRHGLAVQNDDTPAVLAKYSEAMRAEAARGLAGRDHRGNQMLPTLQAIKARQFTPPPSWSPTELGERVLGYYQLAADEFDAAPALPPSDDQGTS
ncbi:MAG TPA: hypothetical protein VNF47_20825 [Streptosporangiaceae bacterium]|nr:hypothetical protein [Streptosporangiaceae bacterium]